MAMKIFLPIILLLPGELQALECFKCTFCAQPFVPGTLVKCASEDQYCAKGTVTTAGKTVVIRTCATRCMDSEVRQHGEHSIMSCCQTDGCNTGMMMSFSHPIVMTSLLMAYFAKGRF